MRIISLFYYISIIFQYMYIFPIHRDIHDTESDISTILKQKEEALS